MSNQSRKISTIRNQYTRAYSQINRKSIWGFGNKFLDRCLEKNRNQNSTELVILEIGASSGEYLSFIRNRNWQKYVALDIQPGKTNPVLMKRLKAEGITFIKGDVSNLPFKNHTFDQILSLCVFAHLENPIQAMGEVYRVLKPGGEFVCVLPTDPGVLNRFLKSIFLWRRMRKLNFASGKFIYAYEHRNAISILIEYFKFSFNDGKLIFKYRPFFVKSWNLNLWILLHFRKQKNKN